MLTPDTVTRAVNKLALMAFFPADPEVRAALVGILMEFVETEEELNWLVARALRLYAKWPGVAELRALYCSRWKPHDGITTSSTVFPDGIPSERMAPPPPALPLGRAMTADSELDAEIQRVSKLKRMPGRAER